MKINTNNPSALTGVGTAATQTSTAVQPGQEGFSDIFARELAVSNQGADSSAVSSTAGLSTASLAGLMAVQKASKTAETASSESAVMNSMDSLLTQWETYAGQLSGSAGGLKNADGVLSSITDGVKKLKEDNPTLSATHPGLSSMVDQLEVMAVTERIKFNRGDYS